MTEITCKFCGMNVKVVDGEQEEHCSLPFVPCAGSDFKIVELFKPLHTLDFQHDEQSPKPGLPDCIIVFEILDSEKHVTGVKLHVEFVETATKWAEEWVKKYITEKIGEHTAEYFTSIEYCQSIRWSIVEVEF
jgi:hypothetical protein